LNQKCPSLLQLPITHKSPRHFRHCEFFHTRCGASLLVVGIARGTGVGVDTKLPSAPCRVFTGFSCALFRFIGAGAFRRAVFRRIVVAFAVCVCVRFGVCLLRSISVLAALARVGWLRCLTLPC